MFSTQDGLQVPDGGWDDWMIHEVHTKHAVEAKYFCAVTVNWRPIGIINLLLCLETISPWWASKHRNIGEIPQQSCRMFIKWLTFPLRWMWPDDALFQDSYLNIVLSEVSIPCNKPCSVTGVYKTQLLQINLLLWQGCLFITITLFSHRGV